MFIAMRVLKDVSGKKLQGHALRDAVNKSKPNRAKLRLESVAEHINTECSLEDRA